MKNEIISFPHLGSYSVPIEFFLKKVTNHKIIPAPKITKKTIELGSKYSPESVCVPFKYNLGNYIESLNNGATILIQAGGGCRYGYYGEVQEKILKDLGYQFKFYSLVKSDHFEIPHIYKVIKTINPNLNIFKFAYYGLLTILMIYFMDKTDQVIRARIGFEKTKGSFKKLREEMISTFSKTRGFLNLTFLFLKYRRKFLKLDIKKCDNPIKIGIIGELYTAMEPFSTFFLEEELAKMNIEIKRFTDVTYLLFIKKWKTKMMLRKTRKYCSHTIGADGLDNIYRALWLIDKNYSGIIHTKPFGCTPEIGAIPIIDKVCKDSNMPIIYFSFDQETSDTGVKTRLEAFYDMIKMKG